MRPKTRPKTYPIDLTADSLRRLPRAQVEEAIAKLSPRQAEALRWDWDFWRLPHQVIEPGRWRWWIIKGGRGSGKTRTGTQESIKRAQKPESCGGQMLIAGRTASDVRDIVVDGQSGILRCSPPWFQPKYEPSKQRITWPTFNAHGLANYKDGVIANLRSGEEPDGIRGLQWGWAWLDEFFFWRDAARAMDEGIEPSGRLGENPQGLITSTPCSTEVARKMCKSHRNVVRGGSTYANRANLPDAFIEAIVEKYEGTRLGRQEIHGEILEDNPGALWRAEVLELCRVTRAPDLKRIVVAVDPAVTYGEKSDETGIVVAGLGVDGRYYVLEDLSGRYSPQGWATIVIRTFDRWKADRVVAEMNQGGDMVEHTMRTIAKDLPIRRIHAKRGKRVRAEPVAALYEQRRVHHVDGRDRTGGYHLQTLETQMYTVEPGGDEHDDRIDALVYAITELKDRSGGSMLEYALGMAS